MFFIYAFIIYFGYLFLLNALYVQILLFYSRPRARPSICKIWKSVKYNLLHVSQWQFYEQRVKSTISVFIVWKWFTRVTQMWICFHYNQLVYEGHDSDIK